MCEQRQLSITEIAALEVILNEVRGFKLQVVAAKREQRR
jgi:hypothetical protein